MKPFKNNNRPFLDPDEVLLDSVSGFSYDYAPEGKLERPIGRLYLLFFLGLVSAAILYLSLRAGFLQIIDADKYVSRSKENRFFTRPILSPRGIIYDKYGNVLAENTPSFGVIFERDAFLAEKGKLKAVLERLELLLARPPEFFFERGFPLDYKNESLPERIVVVDNLDPQGFVSVASALNFVPGVRIFESSRRFYKHPYAFSHLLGFVGKPSKEDLLKYENLYAGETVGKAGVELSYNKILKGRGGRKIVEINADGNETRFKLIEDSEEGSRLRLNIDGSLQTFIYDTVLHYTKGEKAGSAVAIDPASGRILALVSFPSFDVNNFSGFLSRQEFEKILKNPLNPLFNRPISGEYPAGSTLKPLFAAAALEENIIDPQKQIYDEGFISIPNPYKPGEKSIFLDWRKHGWVNFYDAIALSANVYFYMIGGGYQNQEGLGISRLEKYARQFGLGSSLGIDILGEKDGLIPNPEWKKGAEPKDSIWRIGDTYNVSIGQGGVKVTPLQIASLTATIANGGTLYKPRIWDATLDVNGYVVEEKKPEIIREKVVSSRSLEHVIQGMRRTVTSGTARLLLEVPSSVAAKTGTAQVGGKIPPHAWVTTFAPVEHPQIVLTVMVENAGEGATIAVPIARDILKWYFENHR